MNKEKFQQVKEQTNTTVKRLDNIIRLLQRKKLNITYAYYSDGSVVEYDIIGVLNKNVISKMNLVKVEIGNTVTSIGSDAFFNYSKLASIKIPIGVTSIGDRAFEYCRALTSVAIPDGVTSIGNDAFENCSNLTSISIPDSMTSIGNYAFHICYELKSITCRATTAPTVQPKTFGSDGFYTGWNTHSTGNNVLKVPQGATGYDSGYWLDPLQNSEKCGFHIETI